MLLLLIFLHQLVKKKLKMTEEPSLGTPHKVLTCVLTLNLRQGIFYKGKETGQESVGSPKRGSFHHFFFFLFSIPNSKRLALKAFLKVGQHTLFSKTYEKKQAIWLYWFAVQRQLSTVIQQKFDLFCLKFIEEFNELILNF